MTDRDDTRFEAWWNHSPARRGLSDAAKGLARSVWFAAEARCAMRSSRTNVASLLALAALAMVDADVSMPGRSTAQSQTPRRRTKAPDILVAKRHHGMTEEQRAHNAMIDAKRAAKKARKGGQHG